MFMHDDAEAGIETEVCVPLAIRPDSAWHVGVLGDPNFTYRNEWPVCYAGSFDATVYGTPMTVEVGCAAMDRAGDFGCAAEHGACPIWLALALDDDVGLATEAIVAAIDKGDDGSAISVPIVIYVG